MDGGTRTVRMAIELVTAPAALVSQLENLVQLRGRDAQGRIPVDLEFTM